jgi:hypothetical protein
MKNILIFSFLLSFIFISCSIFNSIPENHNTGNYSGSYHKGNYVWGGAMNLAWNELNDSIIKGKVQLKTTDPGVIDMVDKFNNSAFSKKGLDEASYYVKAGFGQETVDEINRSVDRKFPNRTMGTVNANIGPMDLIE